MTMASSAVSCQCSSLRPPERSWITLLLIVVPGSVALVLALYWPPGKDSQGTLLKACVNCGVMNTKQAGTGRQHGAHEVERAVPL